MEQPLSDQDLMLRFRWIPAFLWMVFIFYLSSLSIVDVPEALVRAIPISFDLIGHLGEYAILTVTLLLAFHPQPFRRRIALAFLVASLYALSDEFHQALVPGRAAELSDLALDILGAVLGIAAIATARWAKARLFNDDSATELYEDRKPGYS